MRSSRMANNDMIGYNIQSSFDSMDDELMLLDSSCGSSDEDTIDDDIVQMMNNTEKRKKQQQQLLRTIKHTNSEDSTNSYNNSSSTIKDNQQQNINNNNANAIVAGVATGAAAGAMTGAVLGCGPIIAVGALVALGTAYVARVDTITPIGDVARSVGTILTNVATEVDNKHLHISSNVTKLDSKLHVSETSNAILEKTKDTIVHNVVDNVSNVIYKVNNKYELNTKLNTIWKSFEKNILLTDDTLEFDKQIQYIIMERTLEEEDILYQQQLMKHMKQQQKNNKKNQNQKQKQRGIVI